jgi:hypothetical protein
MTITKSKKFDIIKFIHVNNNLNLNLILKLNLIGKLIKLN